MLLSHTGIRINPGFLIGIMKEISNKFLMLNIPIVDDVIQHDCQEMPCDGLSLYL